MPGRWSSATTAGDWSTGASRLSSRRPTVTDGLLQSLMRNVPGAIYRGAYDADWTMDIIGDEIERISGYPASDFVGSAVRTFASVIHPEDRAMVERDVDAAVARGEPFALEYRI